jgi:hypothetical protein
MAACPGNTRSTALVGTEAVDVEIARDKHSGSLDIMMLVELW